MLFVLFVVLVALAGLGFADWPWSLEIPLRLLFGVGAIIFLVGVSNRSVGEANRRLRAGNVDLTCQLSTALKALERVGMRQTPSFDERIELTVFVGDDDDADLVYERIWTNPTPQLAYRTMRPIVPDDGRVHQLDELDFECAVASGDETVVSVLPLRAEHRRLLLWLDFDPVIDDQAEWWVRYRPRGLWRPLRDTGSDYLSWDDETPNNAHGYSPLRDFKIIFVFPADWAPRVVETRQRGRVAPRRRGRDGRWEIEWHDRNPGGHRYRWDLYRIEPNGLLMDPPPPP